MYQQWSLLSKFFIYSVCFSFNSFWYWDYYFFKSNLSLFIKKHLILFCSFLNMKKQLSLKQLFLCLSCISLMRFCQKKCCREWGVGKKDKKGWWSYRGIAYRRRVQTFCTLWHFKNFSVKKFWIFTRYPILPYFHSKYCAFLC